MLLVRLSSFVTYDFLIVLVCLLIFEHAYFLMQQGSGDWKETLTMAVNKYKSSDIQTAISAAVKAAFQQHGNNGADLCETILRVIRENKISM
ncbi:hypothetical protein BKA83DRAFT_4365008 [Pisolithus microcarpus]|nr:hypothetical protein BKA83DRAFT_4365008 [Pisolithus microcarpus]